MKHHQGLHDQDFLLKLSDILSTLTDAAEIQQAALAMVREHLIIEAAERKQTEAAQHEMEAWLKGQQQAFQAAMRGESLGVSLQPLVDVIAIQTQNKGCAAFYRLSAHKEGLCLVAGTTKTTLNINNFKLGPESLAYDIAMCTEAPVITTDVDNEPFSTPFLDMARKHNYRACWSFPVRIEGGPVLGTLAIYFAEPREPSVREMEMAGILSYAAAIIYSRDQQLAERAEAEDALLEVQLQKKVKQMETDQQLEIVRVSMETLEEERHRISESLHNGLGQVLYGVKISLSALKHEQSAAEFNETLNYTSRLLTEAINETRRISHELMPATLEEFGLKAAIDDICQQLEGSVKFTCQIRGLHARLEKYLELAVYRTAQELMMNVVKHAQATQASVELNIKRQYITLRVTDNGRGIDAARKDQTGIGLTAIRSKIKLLNGEVNIASNPSKGTAVEVIIPMA